MKKKGFGKLYRAIISHKNVTTLVFVLCKLQVKKSYLIKSVNSNAFFKTRP